MTKYVSLKAALRFIPKPLFQQSTELDFLSWMLDAYRELDLPTTLETKVQIFEITDGTLKIPEEVKVINLITYLDSTPSENDVSSFIDCICDPESNANTEDTNNPCQYTLAYKQFIGSSYYKNNYKPLLYKGNNSTLLCDSCPNKYSECQNVFSIDKNNMLHTNIKSGYFCIEYDTEMKDDDGQFLIMDLTEVKRYLAYYAEACHWRERAAVKEQSAMNMAQDALTKAEIYYKKARGIILLSGINPQNITSAQYDNYQNYLKMPEKYVYSR